MSNDTAAPARIANVHIADVVPSRYRDQTDTWNTPDGTDAVTKVSLYSRHQRAECTWSIGYVGPDGSCRRVQGGPIEPGPYAYLVPEATVIHSGPALPGERAPRVNLLEGDLIIIRGVAFRIDDSRGRAGYNPQLIPVTV